MKVHIDKYIEESGLRKGFIAKKLDISSTQLSNVLAGRSFLRTPKLFLLGKILNCKVDDFYEFEEDDYLK
ncbi:helix-turn-helix transcriptional regulator [Cytobacillus oceanisediminis]|uniref:helix-turn-helix domain-containing protein n=1 Tax=Bacillaceae TaxID=186817 RepID=UPI001CCCFD29|nr:helix-turn-helix transcriptional regulator [Cytobacillus oceanisediminis]MBQ6447012.1 helix-turn-helix transcriptional regulator [Bacillus sp. (in: firmicutes)]MBZ9535699.1 helix-turn-helix transcriptional regulator [Cytobacillus oceanisediminis]